MNVALMKERFASDRKLKILCAAIGLATIEFALSGFFPGFTTKHAATNSELAASRSTDYPAIVRDSITTVGDAPPLAFYSSNAPCALNGGAGDIGTQVRSADGKCWIANNGNDLDPREFGAKCDGSTDDATALQAWANRAAAGMRLRIPSASGCAFSSTISFPANSNVTLSGDGRSSRLIYIGASASSDLLVIGAAGTMNGCSGAAGWTIKDFRLVSNTLMTAGDGIHARDICDSIISNVTIGGEWGGGNGNLMNGLHLDGFNSIYLTQSIIQAQADGIKLNGVTESSAHYYAIDFYFSQSKIDLTGVGVHIAGGVGGATLTSGDILENGRHVLVDQAADANPNAQIFTGAGLALDVSGNAYVASTSPYKGNPNNGINIDIEDPGQANNQSILQMNGTWLASAGSACLDLKSGTGWDVTISGGRIYNCQGNGVQIEGANNIVHIAGARIGQNNGYAIYNSGGSKVYSQANVYQPGNGTGDLYGTIFTVGMLNNGDYHGDVGGDAYFRSVNGHTMFLGAGQGSGDCILALQSGLAVPEKGNASSAGCAFSLGNPGAPFASLYANTANFSDPASSSTADVTFAATSNANGVNLKLTGNGATTPSKFMRVYNGALEFLNNAYSGTILRIYDGGAVQIFGALQNQKNTYSSLPTCNSSAEGQTTYVSDANVSTGTITTGSGSHKVIAMCSGVNWIALGGT